MLTIKNIKKTFGNKVVLKGISLNVNKGDIIGIIGPSGCGKSTLLRCSNGLETSDSGEIIFNEKNIIGSKHLLDVRKKIGMVFRQFNLFNHMTVLENITLAPVMNKLMKADEAKKEACKSCRIVHMCSRNRCSYHACGIEKQ